MIPQNLTPEQEEARAAQAQALLRDPLLQEAFNAFDAQLRIERERADARDVALHQALILREQAMAHLQDYLRMVLQGGEAAALMRKEREAMEARIKHAREHGLRTAF